ncbi:hypothetical protein GCM10009087_53670 [Sphingomonas oligophenolica]|uniref:Uncharacterized protein n=1 Tax=Sphingomonas oligophenolica TaxID=301154 RepID=A0ABU9Y7L7_9SPHN
MTTKILVMSGRATALAHRQPRLAVGGSMLFCIILAEIVTAMVLHGGAA